MVALRLSLMPPNPPPLRRVLNAKAMHPCLPNPIPYLPGCVVRRVGPAKHQGFALYSATYWFNGRGYQATIESATTPDLLGVMSHFDRHPSSFSAVSTPVSKPL